MTLEGPQLNLDPLFQAIVDVAAFLELSDDCVIDPDAAIAALESMGASPQELDDDVREQFVEFVRQLAKTQTNVDRAHFFRALPDSFGLIESPDD